MALGKSVNNYYGRMEYILQRWADHGISDVYLKGIFIGGLYPQKFKIAIKEKNPTSLEQAVQFAKQCEEVRIGDDQLMIPDPNIYPPNLVNQ